MGGGTCEPLMRAIFITCSDVSGMQRRRFITAATAAAGMGLLAGCTGGDGGEGSADPLTVGVLVPFSGDYAWVGANVLPVVQMVAEEVNAAGGIGGRQLRVVQGDTEALPDASLSATQQLISVEEVAGDHRPDLADLQRGGGPVRRERGPHGHPHRGDDHARHPGWRVRLPDGALGLDRRAGDRRRRA
jgi:ABC-type branched-chain amino acid transport systems, periplasmic component